MSYFFNSLFNIILQSSYSLRVVCYMWEISFAIDDINDAETQPGYF
jgi:hypothetical protein